MEQGAPEMAQKQFLFQPIRPQFIRVERFKLFRRLGIGGHQAGPGEQLHQGSAAAQIAVAPPPHGAGDAAVHGQGGAGFRIVPIGKNPYATSDRSRDPRRAARAVSLVQPPANRVRSDIKTETHRYRFLITLCIFPLPGAKFSLK